MLFRPARASDMDAICALLATSRRGAEYYHALFASDPTFEPGQFRVAWTGGGIVACARVYRRALRIGAIVVPAGGIGNLRTDPLYQRKGLASSLLVECLSTLRMDGVALALLFASRGTAYSFRGWHVLPEAEMAIPASALTSDAEIGPTGRVARAPEGVSVRPLEERDRDTLLALYESANVARTGSVVRDCPTWLGSLARLDEDGARMLVARRAGEVEGYVVAQPHGRAVEVLELSLAPWAREVWLPLLRAALAVGGTAKELDACLPADYQELITDGLGRDVTIRERDDLRMRLVDPALLSRQVAPLLAARLHGEPVPQPLRVRVGPLRGGAAIAISEERIAVEYPRRDDLYSLPDSLFLSLLFGTADAHALLREQKAEDMSPLPAWVRETLESLFPPQNWVYWRSDSF